MKAKVYLTEQKSRSPEPNNRNFKQKDKQFKRNQNIFPQPNKSNSA